MAKAKKSASKTKKRGGRKANKSARKRKTGKQPATPPPAVEPSVSDQLQAAVRGVARIGRKLKEGKPLTDHDRDQVREFARVAAGRAFLDFDRLSAGQLAAALRKDRRTIQNWHTKGIPRNPDGTHVLADVIRWQIESGSMALGMPNAAGALNADAALKEKRAQLLDFTIARERGSVIDFEIALGVQSRTVVEARAILLPMPEQIEPLLEPANRTEIMSRIRAIIDNALKTLHEGLDEAAYKKASSTGVKRERKRGARRSKK